MDKDTIQQIAAEVVHRLPYGDHPWLFLLVTAALMALVAGVAAWAGAFLKIKGEHFATKQDFDELQRQLGANTKLVETIKSEVSQREWARREWTNLRRTKLEALLEKMHDCETYLDQQESRFLDGKGIDKSQRDHLNELSAIGTLYFPELREEVSRFYVKGKERIVAGLDMAQALGRAGDDLAARQSAFDTFRERVHPKEFAAARSALTDAARRLLLEIVGVDEQTRATGERR